MVGNGVEGDGDGRAEEGEADRNAQVDILGVTDGDNDGDDESRKIGDTKREGVGLEDGVGGEDGPSLGHRLGRKDGQGDGLGDDPGDDELGIQRHKHRVVVGSMIGSTCCSAVA